MQLLSAKTSESTAFLHIVFNKYVWKLSGPESESSVHEALEKTKFESLPESVS
jgi:hypothetical protein